MTHLIRFWRNVLIGRCNSRFQLIGVRDLINNVYCIHIAYIRYSYYIRYSLYGSIYTEVIMYRCKWRSCLHPWLFFSVFPRIDFFLRSYLLYLPENNSLHSQLIILELIMSTDVYSCVDDYSNWNATCIAVCTKVSGDIAIGKHFFCVFWIWLLFYLSMSIFVHFTFIKADYINWNSGYIINFRQML